MSVERSSRRKSRMPSGRWRSSVTPSWLRLPELKEGWQFQPRRAVGRSCSAVEDPHLVAAAPGVGPAARLDLDHLRPEQRELLRAVRPRPDLRQRERAEALEGPRSRATGRRGRVARAPSLAEHRGAIGAGGGRGPAQPRRRRREPRGGARHALPAALRPHEEAARFEVLVRGDLGCVQHGAGDDARAGQRLEQLELLARRDPLAHRRRTHSSASSRRAARLSKRASSASSGSPRMCSASRKKSLRPSMRWK